MGRKVAILDPVISSVAFVAVSLAIFLACRIFERRLALVAGLLFAVYLGLDDLETMPSISPRCAKRNPRRLCPAGVGIHNDWP